MIKTIMRNPGGGLSINDPKQYVKPFWLTPDADQQTMALGAVVGGQALQPATVTQEGPFEGYSLIMESDRWNALADHGCTVMMTDTGSRKQLMNRPCHANTIFGSPNFPMTLPERLFLHENRSLSIRLTNLFAVANDVRPVITGRRIYATSAPVGDLTDFVVDAARRSEVTTPYILTTTEDITALTVAAGATDYFFVSDADAYTEIFKISAACYDATHDTLTGTFDYELFDAETRRQLSSGLLSNTLGMGSGLQPHILAESWLIRPKQRIQIRVTNTTASGNNIDAYISLIGRKIYV